MGRQASRSLVVGETKGKEAVSTPDHRTEKQPQCRGEARDHKRHVFNISPYQEVNLKFSAITAQVKSRTKNACDYHHCDVALGRGLREVIVSRLRRRDQTEEFEGVPVYESGPTNYNDS
jgi:hypothetical protein